MERAAPARSVLAYDRHKAAEVRPDDDDVVNGASVSASSD
jgi:hypothetical protein